MTRDTILLVEDSDDDAFFVRRAMREAGVENTLVHVPNGEEALKELNESARQAGADGKVNLPSLVLLDLKMPVMNGFEFLETVRARPEFSDLVIVILSSSDEQSDVVTAYEFGARGYLPKPPTARDISILVQSASKMPTREWLKTAELPGIPRPISKK